MVSSAEDVSTVLTHCLEKSFVYALIKPYVGSELVAASGKKNYNNTDMENHTDIKNEASHGAGAPVCNCKLYR